MKAERFRRTGPLVATMVVIIAIILATPASALTRAAVLPILAASAAYAGSVFLVRGVWSYLLFLTGSAEPAGVPLEQPLPSAETQSVANAIVGGFLVSTLSLAGVITPMSLGVDVLQSIHGWHYLKIGVDRTAAASLLTRELKLRASFALLLPLILAPASLRAGIWQKTASALVVMLVLVGLFRVTRSKAMQRLTARVAPGDVVKRAREASLRLHIAGRAIAYTALLLAFALEWWSLHFCLASLGAPRPWSGTLLLYAALYFLARVPIVPQGLGLVEGAGYMLLRTMNVPGPESAAVLIVWTFLRLLLPMSLAALAALVLVLWKPIQRSDITAQS